MNQSPYNIGHKALKPLEEGIQEVQAEAVSAMWMRTEQTLMQRCGHVN